jgi:hypothetical protein
VVLLAAVSWLAPQLAVRGQIVEEAVLRGRVMLGDSAMRSATVVLHHLSDEEGAAEVDSTRAGHDGFFTMRLPRVPDPTRGDVYFASVRHAGVMYFGDFVETAAGLDSLYVIQAYDTLLAPPEGAEVALQARHIFLEPNGDRWQATDVFQLRNDRDRTIVARPGGRVWSYPLPAEAREVMTAEGELSSAVATYEDGRFVVRAALPPGERLFVVRYMLETPEVSIPTPGRTEAFDLLVREPAPPLVVEGMSPPESIELDAGETFRRYAAENVGVPLVRVSMGEPSELPQAQWIAVALAVALAAGGLVALRGRGQGVRRARDDRHRILLELARLDEDFERRAGSSEAATREYRRRRAELVRRLKARR